ncbi:MAG TPA: multicopper oxidase domain-containing protein, partial [Vicinamibacterales bacterium]
MRNRSMNWLLRLALVALVLACGIVQVGAQMPTQGSGQAQPPAPVNDLQPPPGVMRGTTNKQREAAAARAAAARAAVAATTRKGGLGEAAPPPITAAGGPPNGLQNADYFGVANYANSPLPAINLTTGAVTGGIRKFINTLPGLGLPGCASPAACNANDLGQFIPIAVADTVSYPGSDYYEISLVQYRERMHGDLPVGGTLLRGYVQTNNGTDPAVVNPTPANNTIAPKPVHYLGPVILAAANRPVRIKFTNNLPTGTGGDLFIPTDTTYMGAGMGPDGTNYTQNRAVIHLHGGNTPWISDGTPHQWTVPVGETATLKKGASATDVPDMAPAADGSLTFYYSNQQSARLMFYHDHAYGLTRLNVYAGEAAGYLLTDPVQNDLINGTNTTGVNPALKKVIPDLGGAYHWGVPLVIQDKTFVPPPTQLAAEDPTWNTVFTGYASGDQVGPPGLGNLWFPHVYIPNQNPADIYGANAFGRWDYGPWFWPVQNPATFVPGAQPYACTSVGYPAGTLAPGTTLTCPGTPNPSGTPESFMDTPVVNGTAYPTMPVAAQAYRFQILNATNDRHLNLGLYYVQPLSVGLTSPGAGYAPPPALPPAVTIIGGAGGAGATAVAAVGANGRIAGITVTQGTTPWTAPPTVTIAPPPAGVGAATATAVASINTEVSLVPAFKPAATALVPPCTVSTIPPSAEGLPVPQFAGTGAPLGGTGLPLNGSTKCWPDIWPTDGRDGGVPDPSTAGPPIIQIGTEGGILPSPVVIPSMPASYELNRRNIVVLNINYHGLLLGPAERADVLVNFSGIPAGSQLILYNDAPAPVPAFDSRLDYYTGDPDQTTTGGAPTTLPGYGPNTRTIMRFEVGAAPVGPTTVSLADLTAAMPVAFNFTQPQPIVPESAYSAAVGKPLTDTKARISDNYLTYTPISSPPLTPPTSFYMEPKAIQELFTLDYGRMNATLGVELPFTRFNTQTTIPLGFVDPVTESLVDGQQQIWKITHNGVDTHAIHFHLFNVQVINRVGWDGMIRPTNANELGWKDTVRMNPLEDVVVALRPLSMALPFGIPNSNRPLDPTQPVGATLSVTNPANGNAIPVVNALTNFGWEYVWHCHILGHEENDMMRPMSFSYTATTPPAPFQLTGALGGPGFTQFILNWRDPTPAATSLGNSGNEIGFKIERGPNPQTAPTPTWTQIGTALANATTFTDTAVPGPSIYRVWSYNAAGNSTTASNQVSTAGPLVVQSLTANQTFPVAVGTPITWTATTTAGVAPISYEFWINVPGAGWTLAQGYSTSSSMASWTPTVAGTYLIQVWARNSGSA